MTFKPPAVLPDYSKLTTALNASGVQKWNPELHIILKQVILATRQSQDVITGQPGGTAFFPISNGGNGTIPIHAFTHQIGGGDIVDVKLLGGYPGGVTSFLRADGTFAIPPGGGGGTTPSPHATTHQVGGTDIVDIKLLGGFPGGTTTFLRADGTFAVASSGTVAAHHTTHEPGGSDALVNAAWTNLSNNFLADQNISKTGSQSGPTLSLRYASSIGIGRILSKSEADVHITANAKVVGTTQDWNLDNTIAGGQDLELSNSGLKFNTFTAGTNPRLPTTVFTINNAGNTQIVGTLDVTGKITDSSLSINVLKFTGGYPGGTTNFLRADGTFAAPPGGGGGGDVFGPASALATELAMFNNVTGKLIAGSGKLSGNIPLLNQQNNFTANQAISVANPALILTDTLQGTDQKNFRILDSGQNLQFQAINDTTTTILSTCRMDRVGNWVVGTDLYEKGRSTPMGHWINVPFSASNFIPGAGAWTVSSGSVQANRYTLIGKTLIWTLLLISTTLNSVSDVHLFVILPGGFTCGPGTTYSGIMRVGSAIDFTGSIEVFVGAQAPGAGAISIQKQNNSVWGTGSLTQLYLTVILEIA